MVGNLPPPKRARGPRLSGAGGDAVLEHLRGGGSMSEADVAELCELATDVLADEGNVVAMQPPVTICGDIHGQLEDLVELFRVGGSPPDVNYVFMGDYVDRGTHSVEVAQLLLMLKLRHPLRVVVLRGNHETRGLSSTYGFYDECMSKYGSPRVWKLMTDVFDYLPLAAVVGGSVLCVHGGLSPSLRTLDDIRALNRVQEPPSSGGMCDLLWSDPSEGAAEGWRLSPRGAGYTFGPAVSAQYCQLNGLSVVARAHQLMMDGFRWTHGGRVLTVFSAPNYTYTCGNLGALVEVGEHLGMTPKQFEAAPRPERAGSVAERFL